MPALVLIAAQSPPPEEWLEQMSMDNFTGWAVRKGGGQGDGWIACSLRAALLPSSCLCPLNS